MTDAAFEAALPQWAMREMYQGAEVRYYTLDQMRTIWNARGEADAKVLKDALRSVRDGLAAGSRSISDIDFQVDFGSALLDAVAERATAIRGMK